MGTTIEIVYRLREDFRVSEERLRDLYSNLSEIGWSYESDEELAVGYSVPGSEWEYGAPFSQAVKAIDNSNGGAIYLSNENAVGFISLHFDSTLSLFIDAVNFRERENSNQDGEKNSRNIIELIKFLCKELEVSYMYGGNQLRVYEHSSKVTNDKDEDPNLNSIEEIMWVNYFSNEIIKNSSIQSFRSTSADFVEEIDEGIFIAPMLKPVGGGGNGKNLKEVNDELGLS